MVGVSRRKRSETTDVPDALRIYDPSKYRAEAEAVYGDWTSDGPADFYYRDLLEAGVDEGLAVKLRGFAFMVDLRSHGEPDNPEWDGPRELFPFGGSMFGEPTSFPEGK